MVSLLPIDTVLMPPPSEMRKESIRERVSKKTSFKRKNQISATAYSLADLQFATDSFSEENLVGEDAIGDIYKAELPNGKVFCILHDTCSFIVI